MNSTQNSPFHVPLLGKQTVLNFIILAVLLAVVMPATLDIFRLNLLGKYLSYAFVAIGLVLCWGYGGILSLGQGIFFGLGGYCMAMFLKLEASTPEATAMVLGAIQKLPADFAPDRGGTGCICLNQHFV